jgi:hypothetical protein
MCYRLHFGAHAKFIQITLRALSNHVASARVGVGGRLHLGRKPLCCRLGRAGHAGLREHRALWRTFQNKKRSHKNTACVHAPATGARCAQRFSGCSPRKCRDSTFALCWPVSGTDLHARAHMCVDHAHIQAAITYTAHCAVRTARRSRSWPRAPVDMHEISTHTHTCST